jgi:HEPN domain-containing protein
MRDAIHSLIQLLKTHSPQIFDLEDDLYELTLWLEKHWEWRDWCALAPRDPEEPHPFTLDKRIAETCQQVVGSPYAWDDELPL